ncbi:hypothetical protein NKG94_04520 [Micromonospora sp. M12]
MTPAAELAHHPQGPVVRVAGSYRPLSTSSGASVRTCNRCCGLTAVQPRQIAAKRTATGEARRCGAVARTVRDIGSSRRTR